MRNKLSLITLAFTIFAIAIGCRKEIKNEPAAVFSSQGAIKTNSVIDRMKADYEKNQAKEKERKKERDKKLQAYRASFEKLKLGHSLPQANNSLSANASAIKKVIRIPADYPTLQDAVDHARAGDIIQVKGTISGAFNPLNTGVFVYIPNLTIIGEAGTSATVNGTQISINAPNVKFQDLTLNMPVYISETGNATLVNNTITSGGVTIDGSTACTIKNNIIVSNYDDDWAMAVFNGGGNTIVSNIMTINGTSIQRFFTFIQLTNSNSNKITNCSVNGIDRYAGAFHGFYLDNASTNNEITNCTAKNFFTGFTIEGDNNRINNCNALENRAGFDSYGCKNNLFTNCNAKNNTTGFSFFFTNNSLDGCNANDNTLGISQYTQGDPTPWKITKCVANNNLTGGMVLTSNGATITIEKNTCNNNKNEFGNSGDGISISFSSGTIQQNTTQMNSGIGINLEFVTNSGIIKNLSINNAICDFKQTNSSGNTVTGNQFGTDCSGL